MTKKNNTLETHRQQVRRIMLRNGLFPEELDNGTVHNSGYTDGEIGTMLLTEEPQLYYDLTDGLKKQFYDETSPYTNYEEKPITDKKKEASVSYRAMGLKFIIPQHIHERITALVDALGKESLEIGGLLKGKRVGDTITITDSITLPQEVGGADFDIKQETVAEWAMEHMDEPDFNEWSGWWHSHHTMGLFWSGTDDAMFTKLLGEKKEYSECFGIVYIVGGEHLARMDIKTSYMGMTIDHVPTTVVGEKGAVDEITATAHATIEECVTRPTTTTWQGRNYGKSLKEEELVADQDLYKKLSYPWDVAELIEYYKLHAAVINNWTLQLECAIWGINYDKLVAQHPISTMVTV